MCLSPGAGPEPAEVGLACVFTVPLISWSLATWPTALSCWWIWNLPRTLAPPPSPTYQSPCPDGRHVASAVMGQSPPTCRGEPAAPPTTELNSASVVLLLGKYGCQVTLWSWEKQVTRGVASPRSMWSRDVRDPRNAFWLFTHRPPQPPGGSSVGEGHESRTGGIGWVGAEGQLCPAQLLFQKSQKPHPCRPTPTPAPGHGTSIVFADRCDFRLRFCCGLLGLSLGASFFFL